MKSRICDISVARCEDRSWLLDPDSQISSEHGIDIWHGEKIWSLWPNPSPTPPCGREMKCWPGCRFKFIEQRYFTFAVKIVTIPKTPFEPSRSVCGPSRDVYIAGFTFEDWSIIDSGHSGESNESESSTRCCCVVVVFVVVVQRHMASREDVSLTEFQRGRKDPILDRSCWNCLERRSQLFEKEFGTSFQFCSWVVIDGLSFMLWDWWEYVCFLFYCYIRVHDSDIVIFLGLRSLVIG